MPISTLRLAKVLIRSRWGALVYFLPSLFAFVAISIAVWRIDSDKLNEHRSAIRAEVTRELGRLASNLKANIAGNVNLVAGLAATLASKPTIDQTLFSALCERILAVKSQVRNLAVAPDLVVTLVYPLAPNLKLIGLDYRTSDAQRLGALKARDSGSITLTGPVDLVQGGTGFIARYPIYIDDDHGRKTFWGLVSAVMDLERLYADSGLRDPRLSIDISLARADQPDTPFFGERSVMSSDPTLLPIDLGYDKWLIAATPKAGWNQSPPDIAISRIYSAAVLIVILGLMGLGGVLLRQRQNHATALQQREQQYETLSKRHEAALEASKIGVWDYDEATGDLIWDARMRDLYDIADPDIPATYALWRNTLHPDDRATAEEAFSEAIEKVSAYTTEFRILTSDGQIRHIRAHGRVFQTARGTKRIVGANWNVTEDVELQAALRDAHQRTEEQNRQLAEATRSLAYISRHDAQTGLPNRRYFDGFIDDATALGVGRISFFHVDLDRFKDINDTFGHAAGDDVLVAAAERLSSLLIEDEFVARIGGDEFVIVSRGDAVRIDELGKATLAALSQPIPLANSLCRIGGSIGIATLQAGDDNLRQLLVNADTALYEAKRLGRNRIEYFTDALKAKSQTLKRRTDDVSRAVENDEFFPVFQPQFDAVTHVLTGVEVLARWQHPTHGVLAPDTFLDIAANLNKVSAIDAMIFEKALVQYMRWSASGLKVPKMSVNVSAQRLMDCDFHRRLAEVRLPGGRLSLELLESISFEGENRALLEGIRQIKSHGHEIEIDDFGTGHASIVSLLELAPQRLKIDRKLIAPIVTHAPQRRIVASMIEIGRSLGIEIIAEGVETMRHAELLCDLGCHGLQGYAFARPMTSDDFMTFARNLARKIEADARRA
jgi:diguanylate cyclase (GGDEF)-like protein